MSQDTQNHPGTSAEQLLALSQVAAALMSEWDEQRLLQLIARTACQLTGATLAAFSLRPIDEEGQPQVPTEGSLFHLAAVIGVTPEQEALFRRMPLGGEGLLAPIFRHGVPVLVADALTHLPAGSHSPLSHLLDTNAAAQEAAFTHGRLPLNELLSLGIPGGHPPVRSFLGAPLLDHAGEVCGELLLGHADPNQFTQEDQTIVLILAGQAAVALENVRLREVARQAQERTRYLEATFEAMVEGVYIYDQRGSIVQMNAAAHTLLARVQQSGVAARPLDERFGETPIIGVEGQRLIPEQWPSTRMLQGEQFPPEQAVELQIPTLDGGVLYANVTGGPIRDAGGQVIGAVGFAHDVTERVLLEQRLRASEREAREQAAQLETIFEAIPDVLTITGISGKPVRVNAATRTLLGLQDQPTETLFVSVPALAESIQLRDENEQMRPGEQAAIARILRGETLVPSNPSISLIRVLDGQPRYFSTTGAPLYDEDGHIIGAVSLARDITEQKQAERQREQQAAQLRLQASLIELAHDAIIVRDPHNVVVSWNQGAEALYGWSAQQAIGQVTQSLLQTHFPISKEVVDHSLEQKGQWEGELVHTCRDGSTVIVESRQVLLRDAAGQPSAILEINRDMTAQRHLEQLERSARAEAERRLSLLQLILDELPSGIYLVRGPEARLVLANRAATTVFGATWAPGQPLREFLAGHGIRILHPNGRSLEPAQLPALRVVQQGESVRQFQEIIRHADETTLPVLVNAVLLDAAPLPGGREQATSHCDEPERAALVVFQDVTALKEAEALKDEFLSIASHELRTPLTVLKGYADLLLQTSQSSGGTLSRRQQEGLEGITKAASHLAELTEDLFDITRLQAGRLDLPSEPVDLVAFTERVLKQQQVTTQRHQLAFHTLHTAHAPLEVNIDPGRLEQILSNLLGNAIKYSPQGGLIEITIATQEEANEAEKAGEAVLSIRDYGMGIPTEQYARIFGRFVRADNARASHIGGTGLGLYLCRELIERYGGRIWFESSEGVGSTFFVALPVIARSLV